MLRRRLPIGAGLAMLVASMVGRAVPAWATQVHTASEGPIGHQMAHLFLMFSLGILVYWLRDRKLVEIRGWRLIQYAALYFILWNVETMVVHYFDGRHDLFEVIDSGSWHARIHLKTSANTLSEGLVFLYYIGKMDHLLCVPAVVLLFQGLRHLLADARKTECA